jgi:hypothetical protein
MASEAREALVGSGAVLKERYRLRRLLGRGGMASVWLAEDEVLERDVAVKVLSDTIASDPDFIARFRREARLAAGLSHPNLIGVWDYAEGGERPYLVMEHVPGEDLAQRMSDGRGIDCDRLARELLGALAHIHAAGIVHRDVKPQNLLIGPDGGAKLIDFGIALPDDATSLTQTGQLLGIARYIAPEVMAGAPATPRADLYSAGVVLRDCLGEGASRELRALVARLTDADPTDRPASAERALAALAQGDLPPEPPTERFRVGEEGDGIERFDTAGPRPARSQPALGRVAADSALVVALGVGVALALAERDSGEQSGGAKPAAAAPEEKPEAPVPVAQGSDPALGGALNQEGFEMIQAGSYEEAVPVLEEAVRSFPSGSRELEYGYALFNLGNALRLSGRPEEAIPVLERRLEIPDQIDVVRSELAAAESEAAP